MHFVFVRLEFIWTSSLCEEGIRVGSRVCVCVCVCVRTGSCASTLRSSRVLRRLPSLKSIVSVTTSVAGGDKLLMLAVTSINVVQYRNYNPDAPDMQG